MTLVISGPCFQGVLKQASYTGPTITGAYCMYRAQTIQDNNIRLIGNIYLYVRVNNSELDDFFSVELISCRQNRGLVRVPFTLPNGSILRLIPLYDFTEFSVWLSKDGVPS